jgi:hypothetical protein
MQFVRSIYFFLYILGGYAVEKEKHQLTSSSNSETQRMQNQNNQHYEVFGKYL